MTPQAQPARRSRDDSTVSVIIPSYNDAVMLRECLRAVNGQFRKADEIIVVDNASEDDTSAVAREAGAAVVLQPVRGVFPATAAGFDAATGDILARLDADSIPPADWLERIERRFAASEELSVLTGPGRFYGSNRFVHWIAERVYIGGYFWFIGLVLGHPPLFGSNLALRASTWQTVRETVHSDRGDVHDDLDLSFHIRPGMVVELDRTLVVGVSARPFESLAGLGRRLAMAYTTIRLNWQEQSPARRRAAHRAGSGR